jgi:hypothetical protein
MKFFKHKLLGGLICLVLVVYILFGFKICGRTVFDDVTNDISFGLEMFKNIGKKKVEQPSSFLWKTVTREMSCSMDYTQELKTNLQELAARGDQNAKDILLDMAKTDKQR